jgi:HAE1 family hydrophobic/amphiphilic exporter-1
MAKFFIHRPIVAMVIAILTVVIGLVSMLGLPIAQFPEIVPPAIQVSASFTGADALTVEQAVATPIEQQMAGVEGMAFMQSTNASNGSMALTVTFDAGVDPNTAHILAQSRVSQAEAQLPEDVRTTGVTVKKANASPLLVFVLTSPHGTYDSIFLANYANINLNDQFTRVPGIASVTVFGAGPYAMRIWLDPAVLAQRNITVPEVLAALKAQNTVNPAGQIGAEPVPPGQEFTYSVRAQGRLTREEEFGAIIVRASPDGSAVRVRDVARVELGAQSYNMEGRFQGKPAAVLALYQIPGSNALAAAQGARALMEELARSFPPDLEYAVALDTTEAVTAGMEEIQRTLIEAVILVILVVFLFLQGWRATLIPLVAVPVSLIGTFAFFPVFGFSINTLSLFGLVLAIGLVVDDAIVVVEAVDHHMGRGLEPREATLRAMEEVTSPIIATSLILAAVFVPTVFIPGITGTLYQQFAVTIAIAVLISTFNALTLSPALCALLLRPRKEGESGGPLGWFFRRFNLGFARATDTYSGVSAALARKALLSLGILVLIGLAAGWIGRGLPPGFLPEEDQGYAFAALVLPDAASLQRTSEAARRAEEVILTTPGVKACTSVIGYNMLSGVQNTYSAFFFITLKPWKERGSPGERYTAITRALNQRLSALPQGVAFCFPPPAIPGIGSAGGVTFVLQDKAGRDPAFLAEQTRIFLEAVRQRPEIASATTPFSAGVPQVFVDVDRDKALKLGVPLNDIYRTLQTLMGGTFVNYFNRFGRQWPVYVQAEGVHRTQMEKLGGFYLRNAQGQPVPLETLMRAERATGPEFTTRVNLQRGAQINVTASPGTSSGQAMAALEEVFAQSMPSGMGFAYTGMSFQEKKAAEGVSPVAIFGLSLLFVFLIMAAQYESWKLPFSVLMSLPVAVLGAFVALAARGLENNVYAQIGLVMLIGLAAKNAILIVEFARLEQQKGRTPMEAALEAARLRLRPILMTSLAFILGCVPLWTASGSGAVGRQVLGTTVIGGMLAASFVAVFLIPAGYCLVESLGSRRRRPSNPS